MKKANKAALPALMLACFTPLTVAVFLAMTEGTCPEPAVAMEMPAESRGSQAKGDLSARRIERSAKLASSKLQPVAIASNDRTPRAQVTHPASLATSRRAMTVSSATPVVLPAMSSSAGPVRCRVILASTASDPATPAGDTAAPAAADAASSSNITSATADGGPTQSGDLSNAVASIDDTVRYAPTTRPDTPVAQKPPEATTRNVDTGRPFLQWQRGTDDWFGLRPALDDKGISLNASLTVDAFKGLKGGLDTSGSSVGELFNLNLTLDTEKLLGWKGGTFFTNFQMIGGQPVSDLTGSALSVSNIDADDRVQLSELWYEQSLLDGLLVVRGGKIDAATQFAHPLNADEFVNGASATNPTIQGLPTYPDPATGLELIVKPADSLYFAFGVFDGALRRGVTTGNRGPASLHFDDLFLIAEGGVSWSLGSLEGRLVVGGWYHTNSFDRFGGGTTSGTGAPYVVLDQAIWKAEPDKKDDTRGIAAFATWGCSDPNLFDIAQFVGAGLVWTGPMESRPDDAMGVSVNTAFFAGKTGSLSDTEVQIELFYKLKVLGWLSIKPDLIFTSNPSGDGGPGDSLIGGVRVVADF